MDVTRMFEDYLAHGRIFLNGLINIDLRLLVTLLHEQNPGISVKKRAVIWLGLDCTVAHLLGFLKVFALFAEIIGVIVETAHVVGFPLQATVIGGKSLGFPLLLVEDVAHDRIEITYDFLIAVLIDLAHSRLERLKSLILSSFWKWASPIK